MAIHVFPRVGVGELRRGHWSTRGLQYVMNGMDPMQIGFRAYNPVSGVLETVPQSGTASPLGGYHYSTNGAVFTEVRNGAKYLTNQGTILCIRQKYTTDLIFNNGYLFGIVDGANTISALVPAHDDVCYWWFGGASGSNQITASGASHLGIQKWAFVAGSRGMAMYLNGTALATSSTGVTRTGGDSVFFVNASDESGGYPQDIYFFAILDAEWTAAQVAEWTANPLLMFESRQTRRALGPVYVSGAGISASFGLGTAALQVYVEGAGISSSEATLAAPITGIVQGAGIVTSDAAVAHDGSAVPANFIHRRTLTQYGTGNAKRPKHQRNES